MKIDALNRSKDSLASDSSLGTLEMMRLTHDKGEVNVPRTVHVIRMVVLSSTYSEYLPRFYSGGSRTLTNAYF